MKVLKSHRDPYFVQWVKDDLMEWGRLSNISRFNYVSVDEMQRGDVNNQKNRFNYVSVDEMQRGDVTPASEKWLKKNAAQNFDLLEALRVSIPRDGMISPIILVGTKHSYWDRFIGKIFWESIPFVIQTGNNRYRVAVENGYTHISSICLGTTISPRVWNYLQAELKRPLEETINVSREDIKDKLGESI